jgi:hypothetical protein
MAFWPELWLWTFLKGPIMTFGLWHLRFENVPCQNPCGSWHGNRLVIIRKCLQKSIIFISKSFLCPFESEKAPKPSLLQPFYGESISGYSFIDLIRSRSNGWYRQGNSRYGNIVIAGKERDRAHMHVQISGYLKPISGYSMIDLIRSRSNSWYGHSNSRHGNT